MQYYWPATREQRVVIFSLGESEEEISLSLPLEQILTRPRSRLHAGLIVSKIIGGYLVGIT